ncbi:vWA domain-containing protein [Ornithinibacillus halophilus]|uniref:Ca-activated chloride channel family protein n=1 Tax=Ornithinibacillus halophilus TaxID=930117 RepID=A0A1M5FU64_9BACI|nr:VWA domain-containing protein [Ornithinibacillus halophilus]SHF95117.1 Ca-activated chloride channel family protein [Ornithinibacillus halophilus]
MKKIIFVLLFFSLCLAACSNEEPENELEPDDNNSVAEVEDNDDQNQIENDHQEKEEERFSIASLSIVDPSREGMINQVGGQLLEGITLEQEIEMDAKQFVSEHTDELTEYLQLVTSETQNPIDIEKAIVHFLGSPNYTEAIESALAYDPDFPEPDLPGAKVVEGEEEGEQAEKGKAILLLDASSSMLLSVDGRVKMDIAKEAVQQFADVIGQDNDISLVVYGHKGSESGADKQLSCETIEEIYPLGAYEQGSFEESLASFESKGWTPLAGAIEKATEMSQDTEGAITLYIVSDGVETCDGNPVLAAESFVKENEHRKVNIIGFNVNQDAEEQLKDVSEAGNGEYYSADDADELKETIEYEWLPSRAELAWAHTKAPGPWEILRKYEEYDEDHDKIRALVKKEDERYDQALIILRDEEMVPREVRDELRDLLSGNYTKRFDELRDLRSQKIDEINAISDEIKERVNEWKEEMSRRKDERGDAF